MYGGDSQAVEHRTTPSILYLSRTGTLLYIYISRHSSHWPSPYKYKSTSVASALAVLSRHTDFPFTLCFMIFILHHTLHILHFISQRPGGLINPLLVLSMYMTYSEESGSLIIFIDSYLRTRHIHELANHGLKLGLYSSSSYEQRVPDLV